MLWILNYFVLTDVFAWEERKNLYAAIKYVYFSIKCAIDVKGLSISVLMN